MAEQFESEMKALPDPLAEATDGSPENAVHSAGEDANRVTSGFYSRARPGRDLRAATEPARCRECGFPLIPREGAVCHRCRGGNWAEAREVYERAQGSWEHAQSDSAKAGAEYLNAEQARDAAKEVWRHAEADWQDAQQREAAASARSQQEELDWEQAQTAWGEAQEAHAERLRRHEPHPGDVDDEESE